MSGHHKPIPVELRPVIESFDLVVAAVRLTRCPDCKARKRDSCPKQGINCAAISSGLAHLWSELDNADRAVAAAGLNVEEKKR